MQTRIQLFSLIAPFIVLLVTGLEPLRTAVQSPSASQSQSHAVYGEAGTSVSKELSVLAGQQVRALVPTSEQMVNSATAVLSKGLKGMSQQEREALLNLYDPAETGDVDEAFVQRMLSNYERVRQAIKREIRIVYEADHDQCQGQRLYFTDLLSLHVCPYFFKETDSTRKARTLIHEYAHIALWVKDRPYYRPTSKAYTQLTPRGSWAAQLPVIGPIVREIAASDTLYHPDAYAHFALAMSGQPGAIDNYLDKDVSMTITPSNNGEGTRFKQIAAVLSQSETGRRLLSLREAYQIEVQFEEGSGSRFRKHENLILLDSNHDPVKAALFLAHEMHHAQAFHEGEQARAKTESRQAYIEHKLREEAQGMAISFQLKMELEQIDPRAVDITLPMESQYRDAYLVAAEQTRSSASALSEQQINAIGRSAGERALYETFASGEIQTSNTYEPYPDYYGSVWDKAHPIQAFMSNSPFFSSLSDFAANIRAEIAL